MSDDEATDLRQRVNDLERQIKRMQPSRRDMLKGGAALVAGAGIGSAATGQAMAQPTGDEPAVGEQGDRVEAWISETDLQEINNAVHVSTESEFNQAITDGETVIVIDDVGTASSKLNTVTTRGTQIIANGFARGGDSAGDIISANFTGEVLEIAARDCELHGVAISNEATDGDCILNNEAQTRFVGCNLYAGRKGVDDESGAGGLQFFENVVWCADPGSAGSIGIDADTSTDCYFGGNKIVQFDTGVLARSSSHLVWGEHIFGASSGSYGGRYGPNTHVANSRFDIKGGAGNSGDAALEIGLNGGVLLSDLWTTGDADGIRITGSGGAEDTPIRMCEFDGGTAATDDEAIALDTGVSGPTNSPTEDQREIGGFNDTSNLGPSWVDETSNRSFDTQETNQTGREIEVSVSAGADSDNIEMGIFLDIAGSNTIDWQDVSGAQEFDNITVQGTVPPGDTYEVRALGDTGSFSLNMWWELQP